MSEEHDWGPLRASLAPICHGKASNQLLYSLHIVLLHIGRCLLEVLKYTDSEVHVQSKTHVDNRGWAFYCV